MNKQEKKKKKEQTENMNNKNMHESFKKGKARFVTVKCQNRLFLPIFHARQKII